MFPISSIQWLADKLLQRRQQQKSDLKEKRERVAAYFDELADTLHAVLDKFRANEVPRIDGNKFEVLLSNFTRVVHSIYDPEIEDERTKVREMLDSLVWTSRNASDEDALMTGKGYFGPGHKKDLLESLERLVGTYRGLAASLRAIGLE